MNSKSVIPNLETQRLVLRSISLEDIEPYKKYFVDYEVIKYSSNAVGNTASRRVKEKSGAKLLGVRPASFVSPEFREAELWELKKEDYV